MRKEMAEKGIKLISKAPVPKDTGKFTKEDFQIDLEQGKVIRTFVFSKETCPELPEEMRSIPRSTEEEGKKDTENREDAYH